MKLYTPSAVLNNYPGGYMQLISDYIKQHGFTCWINPMAESVSFWLPASDGSEELVTVSDMHETRIALGY